MYIGKVSKITGATPKAIRHYEAIGLIAPPKRMGKYRYYTEADIKTICLIKYAQKYGFKLSELETIAQKTGLDNKFPYDELIVVIETKRKQIRVEIDQLKSTDLELKELCDQIKLKKCFC